MPDAPGNVEEKSGKMANNIRYIRKQRNLV